MDPFLVKMIFYLLVDYTRKLDGGLDGGCQSTPKAFHYSAGGAARHTKATLYLAPKSKSSFGPAKPVILD
jgi:hypothetical protein